MTTKLEYNYDESRYEETFNGELVFANVREFGGVFYIDYVEASPKLRGTGAAGQFMKDLMSMVKNADLKAKPLCGYAASWLRKHNDEYKGYLAA